MKTQMTPDRNVTTNPTLQSQDIVAGLGSAPRDLMATCLALFEDSTLQQRLTERFGSFKDKLTGKEAPAPDAAVTVTSLQQRVMHWMNLPVADDELRLVLWMRLRQAFDLQPLTFGALRSARTAADDVVASTLKAIQPGSIETAKRWSGIGELREIPDSLDALARQTMAELVANVMQADDAASAPAREALVRDMKKRVSQLDPEARDRLLKAINAREFNDDAIRTMMLTGGGLATFGSAVSVAGFSAYILAAQASAFIPLVSGPALVSFVAVLSNPITIVLATAGAGVWATRSANQKIQTAIAMRVISLLALNGIAAGDSGLRQMTRAFALLPEMRNTGTLDGKVLVNYQANWASIASAHRKAIKPSSQVIDVMERPLPGLTNPDRWEVFLRKDDGVLLDMAAMSALTLGELLYNIHALDPNVVAAADFSRVTDLSDPAAFAAFAHAIEAMGNSSHLGAISNLKGYVAERVVASQLIEQGHVIEFPELSNEPGWDIAVDGVKFQVKNAADLSLLDRHFDHGYVYPILANAEVADLLAKASEHGNTPDWAEHVHFVEGYSQEAVQQVTAQTLDSGDAMLHPHVPVFAVTLGAIRQLSRYSQGQVTGSQAVQEVLLNGTTVAGLAVVGNYAGVAIGLLVFGPAGALVLGSTLPIVSRSQVGRVKKRLESVAKSEDHRRWETETRDSFNRLTAVLEAGLTEKAERIRKRSPAAHPGLVGDYLCWRLDDDLRFLLEAGCNLQTIYKDVHLPVEDAGEGLLIWLSTCTLHPAVFQKELHQWLKLLERKPTITENISKSVEPFVTSLTHSVTGFFAGARYAIQERKSTKKTKD